MKQLFSSFPFLSRIALALVLGAGALFISGVIYQLFPVRSYFPFVAEALLIVVTWLLLRTDGQPLSTLGLNPSFRNIAYLFWGLVLGAAALLAATWLRTLYTGELWHCATTIDKGALLKSLYFILPTVVVQELMFRGYLFTKTISRFGAVRANVIFSLAFMLVHVLDRDVLQNPAQLLFLAVSIPVGHLWFAAALQRCNTIFFPIGLHWGNNWVAQALLSRTGRQDAVVYLEGTTVYTTWFPFVVLLLIFNGFFLLVTLAIWKGNLPARLR